MGLFGWKFVCVYVKVIIKMIKNGSFLELHILYMNISMSVFISVVQFVLRELSDTYIERLIPVLADRVFRSPHVQYYLHWSCNLLLLHTQMLKQKGLNTKSLLTDLQKSVLQRQTDIGKL